MDTCPKPKFNTIPLWGTLTTVLSTFACFKIFDILNDYYRIIISIVILIIIQLINLFFYIKQVTTLYNSYIKRISNHEALAKEFNLKTNVILNKNNIINMQSQIINRYILIIFTLISSHSIDEIKQIISEDVANIIQQTTILNNNLNGGNNNE